MCGIAGWFGPWGRSREEAEGVLRAMTDSLRHRGPDDEGRWLDEHAALGHRRLSIIDLAGGHQPMWNEEKTLGIVFNGEIYNFLELRPALEKKGYRFRTNSDTEVLLALYAEEGEEMLSRLNGMFSFALYDTKLRRLFCARDRAGKKPFYYAQKNGVFLFASEPKALLCHPLVSRSLDLAALARYLMLEYIPAPFSIYSAIKKLPGAHAMLVEEGKETKIWRYWNPKFPAPAAGKESDDEAAARVGALLEDAVAKRLISDVPLGVFLSGGIDSTMVVAMMARRMKAKDIKTFCIGFREKSFDESRHARAVAEHFGADHHEDVLDASGMTALIPEIAALQDEPFADPSIVPTYMLSRFTRRHVTVALGGDGGDELFAGYPTFFAHRMADSYERFVPRFVHRGVERAAAFLPASYRNMSLDFRIKCFLAGMYQSEERRHWTWLGAFSPEMQRELFLRAPEGVSPDALHGETRAALAEAEGASGLDRALYLYFRMYLQDDILVKVDRASMMHSLEARAPFLDVRVIEAALALPARMKLRGGTLKYILKKILTGHVPPPILKRPKKGFGIPVAQWFKEDLKDEVADVFSEEKIRKEGLFSPSYVSGLVREHREGKRDHRKALWTLYMFEKWRERWLPGGVS